MYIYVKDSMNIFLDIYFIKTTSYITSNVKDNHIDILILYSLRKRAAQI